MNQLNERDIHQHVTVLGWLYIGVNAILLPLGLFGFLFFVGIGLVSADPTAFGVLGVLGMISLLFFTALALPGLLTGYGLLRRKRWGQILAIIVGALNLPSIPLGTALGAYTLFVLLQDSANGYFEAPNPARGMVGNLGSG